MNKFFMDCEFIEGFTKPLIGKSRHYIDLISIAIVSDDGREYYAVSKEYDYNKADSWVKQNVILPIYKAQNPSIKEQFSEKRFHKIVGKSLETIKKEILQFIGKGRPDFYGYFCDYDWVLFCSIFGRMVDLPGNFSMFCRDIHQMRLDAELSDVWKAANAPDPKGEHNALIDARWNRDLYYKIINEKNENQTT